MTGLDATWLGTLQPDSYPAGVAAVGPARLALTATDPDAYRARSYAPSAGGRERSP
ncbi:hypothetical protein [Amycolatopsis pithecellobii]|uniref:Uncharacterized protein n=1 Tax=Amycolatopsis pithecellobii TaxID=664692 RepID=A0A6N7Z7J4_9PSEU|nr:hypothetical protein [Amycolatopsis pithecellobii]MTD58169.1 hypothetical protein [Amycolatopsis pithecellobii]